GSESGNDHPIGSCGSGTSMRIRTRVVVCWSAIVFVAVALSGCRKAPSSAPASSSGSAAAPQKSSDVVARLGDRSITLAEVDAKWRETDAAEQMKATETLYNGRRAALDAIIGDDVLERAAKKRGVTVEKLLQQELAKRAQAVAPADIEAFYNDNRD